MRIVYRTAIRAFDGSIAAIRMSAASTAVAVKVLGLGVFTVPIQA
jgi:hypothetical protein